MMMRGYAYTYTVTIADDCAAPHHISSGYACTHTHTHTVQGNKEDKERKQELVFQLQEALQQASDVVQEKENEKDGLQKVGTSPPHPTSNAFVWQCLPECVCVCVCVCEYVLLLFASGCAGIPVMRIADIQL
jgi:hypothetical protein